MQRVWIKDSNCVKVWDSEAFPAETSVALTVLLCADSRPMNATSVTFSVRYESGMSLRIRWLYRLMGSDAGNGTEIPIRSRPSIDRETRAALFAIGGLETGKW